MFKIPFEVLRIERLGAYNAALRWYNDEKNKDNENRKAIGLLIDQSTLSYEAKNELYYKCLELGIMKLPKGIDIN